MVRNIDALATMPGASDVMRAYVNASGNMRLLHALQVTGAVARFALMGSVYPDGNDVAACQVRLNDTVLAQVSIGVFNPARSENATGGWQIWPELGPDDQRTVLAQTFAQQAKRLTDVKSRLALGKHAEPVVDMADDLTQRARRLLAAQMVSLPLAELLRDQNGIRQYRLLAIGTEGRQETVSPPILCGAEVDDASFGFPTIQCSYDQGMHGGLSVRGHLFGVVVHGVRIVKPDSGFATRRTVYIPLADRASGQPWEPEDAVERMCPEWDMWPLLEEASAIHADAYQIASHNGHADGRYYVPDLAAVAYNFAPITAAENLNLFDGS